MEKPNEPENLNYQLDISLYRISDEVKNELVRALNFWNVSSGSKDPMLTALIIKELKAPYATTNMIDKSAIGGNGEEQAPFIENPRLRNGVVAFKQQMLQYLDKANSQEAKDLIKNLITTFEIAIESVL